MGKRGAVVWLTGLSGSGKTTIACTLAARFETAGHLAYVLDGDRLRTGLNSDLGFSPSDRAENVRRAGHVAALFADAGVIAIAAFISPYRRDRDAARAAARGDFLEVYLDTPLEVCERRDAKGLYKRARAGEIADFTGISAPYEAPENPEIRIDTSTITPDDAVNRILDLLAQRGAVSR